MTTPTMNNTETEKTQQVKGATLRLMCMVGSIFSSPKSNNDDDDKDSSPKNEAEWNRDSAEPVHHQPTEESVPAALVVDTKKADTEDAGVSSESESDETISTTTGAVTSSESETEALSGSASEKEQEHQPRIRRGDKRLLCPFSIKFSQTRCRPNFQDGREVEDASALVTSVPFAEAWTTPAQAGDETAENLPNYLEDKYDEFLAHPFPTIEVIRWRAKVRDAEGKEIRDPETGRDKMGEEQWFTLDNRRLYALQKAAVRMWPKRCCVVVRVLRGDFGHALKKFKTLTNGQTVEVGNRFWGNEASTNPIWSWEVAVKSLPNADSAQQEAARLSEAIKRDEARENECALVRAGGCAHLLELPKYKGVEGTPVPQNQSSNNFKLPAATKKPAGESSKRFEYWLASKEGMAPPAKKKTPPSSEKKKEFSVPSPAPSMADRIAALARQKQQQQGPGSGKVLDLLQVMNKNKTPTVDVADAETTASSGGETPDACRKSLPAPRIPEEKRQEKRRQRARTGRGGSW